MTRSGLSAKSRIPVRVGFVQFEREACCRKVVTIAEQKTDVKDKFAVPKRPRPVSAPPRRPRSRPTSGTRAPAESAESPTQLQEHFNRSLRLLGLQINHPAASRQSRFRPPIVERPTFSTRLTGRSVSLENVKDLRDRSAVACAVYQKWYFTKQAEEKRRRVNEATMKALELDIAEQRKAELKQKAEENFNKWLQRKLAERSELLAKERRLKEIEEKKVRDDAEKLQRALEEWTVKKEMRLKQEAREKREKEKREAEKKQRDEEQKRQHAKESYAAWLKKARELKLKREAEEQKARAADAAMCRAALERRLEAEQSFASWRTSKQRALRTRLRELRWAANNVLHAHAPKVAEERLVEERRRKIAERLYEADQAYSEWLDAVTDRDSRIVDLV